MSFPRYPAYKPSGVEWLGEVPEHWNRTALKYLGDYQNGYPFKPEDRGEEGLPIIRISQLTGEDEPAYYSGSLDSRVKVRDGELLFSWSATIDSFIWNQGEAWLNQHIFKVSPSSEADKGYLYYVIKHVAPKLADFDAHGSTMRHIKKESLGERVYIPPINEQRAVATFLDRETAKIDALIAEQQRLIELLQEKRQAVISHAVTKGLNPDAPMKDSGVEWLGEVPEHWEVKRVRHLLKSLSQGSSPNCLQDPAEDGQFGVLKVGCVNQSEFIPQENKGLPGDVDPDINSLVLPGDVLMSRGNTKELVGLTTVVPQGTEKLLASDLIFILRLEAVLASPDFIALSLRSDFGRSQIEPQTVGTSTSMQKINQSTIKELIVALPPLTEQIGIVESIRSSLRLISCQVQNCSLAIELLQERRSALISAAVTGQIDVRGLVTESSDA